MSPALLSLLHGRRGHFQYESGLHGETWYELELLCRRPAVLEPYVKQLAARLAPYQPEVICGPLIEGALVGLLVAAELGCEFCYAVRLARRDDGGLYPVRYQIPGPQRSLVRGRRVAIVNDVISAGSAVRGAVAELRELEADIAAIGALLVLGDVFPQFASEHGLRVEALERGPFSLWEAKACPLCTRNEPLQSLAVY